MKADYRDGLRGLSLLDKFPCTVLRIAGAAQFQGALLNAVVVLALPGLTP